MLVTPVLPYMGGLLWLKNLKSLLLGFFWWEIQKTFNFL